MARILQSAGALPTTTIESVVIVLTALAVFVIGVTNPFHNWDMIPYIAAAYHRDGLSGEALRDKTYASVRDEVPPERFKRLTTGRYRQAIFEDPRALEQQLPFYTIKPLYVELIRVAGRLGLTYAKATYWVSALFAALSVVVLGLLSRSLRLPVLMVPLLVLAAGHIDVAEKSVPDAPAYFLAFVAVWFALKRNRMLFVASALLPLARADYILLCALLMLFAYREGRQRDAVISFAASVAAYAYVNFVIGDYGWLKLFNFTFMTGGGTAFPAEMPISTEATHYVQPYLDVWERIVRGRLFVIFCLAAVVILHQYRMRMASREFWMLLVIPFAYLGLRLVVFPNYEDRYFVFSASLMLLALLAILCEARKENR